MRILPLAVAAVLAGAAAAYVAHYRWHLRELGRARAQREVVLARLARGAPLPPNVRLAFPAEHPATGAPATPVAREAFLAALASGPYRYPSTVHGYVPRGSWAPRFGVPPAAAQTYQLATGQAVDVLARRRGADWEVAVVTPWHPGLRPGLR